MREDEITLIEKYAAAGRLEEWKLAAGTESNLEGSQGNQEKFLNVLCSYQRPLALSKSTKLPPSGPLLDHARLHLCLADVMHQGSA